MSRYILKVNHFFNKKNILFELIFLFIIQLGFADIQVFAESITISQITETDSISQRPQIFSQNEKIFLVWTEKYENNAEILFSKSSDGGITFSTPINLSKNEGVSAFPRISVSGDSVFVTWYDYSDGQSEIYFAKSEDGGETFSVLNISNNTSASYNPWVSSNSKFVYLVWNDGGKSQEIEFADGKKRIVDVLMGNMEIFFATSNDDGKTFETKNLSNIHGKSLNPRMRINEENIYVTWTEQSENSEIFFSKSEDSGKTFSNPINISNSPGNSFDVGIKIHENEVFLIWKEKSSEHQEVFFSKSVDNGNTFDYPIKISGTSTNVKITRDTNIVLSYPNLFVVFYDSENSDVFLSYSADAGIIFGDPINLSKNQGKSEFAQIIAKDQSIIVVWNDYSNGNGEVYLRVSKDLGKTFGPIKNLSDDGPDSILYILGPQISMAKNKVYVVWENSTDLQSNLFLSKIDYSDSFSYSLSDRLVEITIENDEIIPNQEIAVSFSFIDPLNDEPKMTQYSIKLVNSMNDTIYEVDDIAEDGKSTHIINFPEKGQYSLFLITDENFEGMDEIQDQDIIINVIPEFPYGPILIFTALITLIILLRNHHKVIDVSV